MAKQPTAPARGGKPASGKPVAPPKGSKPAPVAAAPRTAAAGPRPPQQQQHTAAPVDEPKNAIVPASAMDLEALDEATREMLMEDDALGVSYDAEDNLLQFIKVLQPLSPEILAGPAQIEGAEAGDFFCRGLNPELLKSIWFQPCGLKKFWLEFILRERGGGFVGRYECNLVGKPVPPEGAFAKPDNPNALHFPDTGNSCTLYRVVPGILWLDQQPNEFVLNFYGTGHSVHKQWNGKMLKKINPRTKRAYPSYSYLYELTTALKTNKKGSWYQISVSNGTPVVSAEGAEIVGDSVEALRQASILTRSFAAGEREARFEAPDDDGSTIDGEVVNQDDGSVVDGDDLPY